MPTDKEILDWIEKNVSELRGNVQQGYSPWDVVAKSWPKEAGSCGRKHLLHQGNLHMDGLRNAVVRAMYRLEDMKQKEAGDRTTKGTQKETH